MEINKITIEIPAGIKYISDWKDYEYPKGQCIIDKGVTGCGFTEYCLRNDLNLVLCSPRKMLLENKAEQHAIDDNIFYLKNEIENFNDVLNVMNTAISGHITKCLKNGKPIKFMVTYDSAHYIIDYIKNINQLDNFMFVADEFQSIFLDSYFKAEVENSFVCSVQDCPNIIYLSATPMLDKYLLEIDQFKNLTYYKLDWSKTGYVETLQIQRKVTNSLGTEIGKVIDSYLAEDFPITVNNKNEIVKSTEAVFYVNSVTEIVRAINSRKLKPNQVNILCADTPDNRRKIKKIKHTIGKIPLKDEPRKMFTFCTSTCYIGADFYSDNASTYIFADPNFRWLALDISLDLPQIAGRQRDRNNPFKNNITIFYKLLKGENLESREEFDEVQKQRKQATKLLLDMYYTKANAEEKGELLKRLKTLIGVDLYSNDFISISSDGNPVYNKLIEVAHIRAWEVSQKDYQDTINVTKALESIDRVEGVYEYKDRDDNIIQDFLDNKFYKTSKFPDKLKYFCEFTDKYKNNIYIMKVLNYKIPDIRFRTYYNYFGTNKCKSLRYRDLDLHKALLLDSNSESLSGWVYKNFFPGIKYSKKEIKDSLSQIYFDIGINIKERLDNDGNIETKEMINRTAKATDIEEWFEIKECLITVDNKRVAGYELISKKQQ